MIPSGQPISDDLKVRKFADLQARREPDMNRTGARAGWDGDSHLGGSIRSRQKPNLHGLTTSRLTKVNVFSFCPPLTAPALAQRLLQPRSLQRVA